MLILNPAKCVLSLIEIIDYFILIEYNYILNVAPIIKTDTLHFHADWCNIRQSIGE